MANQLAGYDYVQSVLKGKTLACSSIIAACQRSKDDLARQKDPTFPYVFSDKHAQHVIAFAEQLKATEGPLAGKHLTMQPWQKWILGQLYGWRVKEDLTARRFQEALVQVARKNGKSAFTAVLGLYELLFGDEGAQVVSAATTRDQAAIVFRAAKDQIEMMAPAIAKNLKVTTGAISCAGKRSSFKAASREAKSLEGLNVSLGIIDEAAMITDSEVIDSITSSVGGRFGRSLVTYITTAQTSKTTRYYSKLEYARLVMDGINKDETIFAAIYELDKDDDWKDSKCWPKSNPNMGISMSEGHLKKELDQAVANPSMRSSFLRRYMNIWAQEDAAWVQTDAWDASISSVDRTGGVYLGMDLAQTRDLCAVTRVWDNGYGKYSMDYKCFLPRIALADVAPAYRQIYETAVESGSLVLTEGPITDYSVIQEYIQHTAATYDIQAIGYDSYNASMLVSELDDQGLPLLRVNQGISVMSAPSKQTEALILSEAIAHDDDTFFRWQLENCVVYTDPNENIKVRKGSDPNKKVDAVIALIMAIATVPEAEAPPKVNFEFISF